VDGGMLWRNGCDGKVLRCGAGNRHQHIRPPSTLRCIIKHAGILCCDDNINSLPC
jgi:L-asparaginase II